MRQFNIRGLNKKIDSNTKIVIYRIFDAGAFISGLLAIYLLIKNNGSTNLSNIFTCLLFVLQIPGANHRYKRYKSKK